jgi:hypothetical protein
MGHRYRNNDGGRTSRCPPFESKRIADFELFAPTRFRPLDFLRKIETLYELQSEKRLQIGFISLRDKWKME